MAIPRETIDIAPHTESSLGLIIEYLTHRKNNAQRALLLHLVKGIRDGLVTISRTDTDWERFEITLRMPPFVSAEPHPFTLERMRLGFAYDKAQDALEPAKLLLHELEKLDQDNDQERSTT
jgi:hypothetical protein